MRTERERNKRARFVPILALLIMTACTNNEVPVSDTGTQELSFTASIQSTLSGDTRMATDAQSQQNFSTGDQIGLYAVAYQDENTPKTLQATSNRADNAPYVAAQPEALLLFQSDNPVRFPSGSVKKLDLYAYYPYSEAGFSTESTRLSVKVETNQSEAANFWKSDFMTATESGVTIASALSTDNDTRLKLNFEHRFSLIKFEVKQGMEFSSLDDLGTPALKLINLCTQGAYDWSKTNESERLVLAEDSQADVTPYGTFAKADESATTLTGVTALILPQSVSKDTPVCRITAAGMTFPCKLSADLTLEGGKSYTFTLTLNKSTLSGITCEITPWVSVPSIGNIAPGYPVITD